MTPFFLTPLPYAEQALEPHISAETLHYHHGKHAAAYVDKLNSLIVGTPYAETSSLEDIVLQADGAIFTMPHRCGITPFTSSSLPQSQSISPKVSSPQPSTRHLEA